VVYSSRIHDVEHLALIKGTLDTSAAVLVRVQVENTIADVFGGPTPPSRDQIHNSLRALSDRGSGVILYLRKASLGESSAFASAPAPERTHEGSATAGMREYGVGAQILRDMGITHIELLSSTQRTLKGLDSFGITVTSQRAIPEYEEHRKEQAP
jgi:3,4-dihydroxy 2-butanone 4-phosphate synthase/GTP cyclohydrolase II